LAWERLFSAKLSLAIIFRSQVQLGNEGNSVAAGFRLRKLKLGATF
jgi:hypothetical protein